MKSEMHDAPGSDVAVREIVAGVAALRGPDGLEELVVDLAKALADVIEWIAAAKGVAAEDVAGVLFFGGDFPASRPGELRSAFSYLTGEADECARRSPGPDKA